MRTNPGMRAFPALGFDPAPGSPAALAAQARGADLAARALASAAAAATRALTAGGARPFGDDVADGPVRWGPVAAAALDGVGTLPGDLHRAAAAHRALARALTAYGEDLTALQDRATVLEGRAAALLRTSPPAPPPSVLAELAGVVAEAVRVRDEHRAAVATAVARIRAATDPPHRSDAPAPARR